MLPGLPRSGSTTPPGPFGIQDPQGWLESCVFGRCLGGLSKPTRKTIQENGTNWAAIKKFVGMCEKLGGVDPRFWAGIAGL